jgi:hypothetical protein
VGIFLVSRQLTHGPSLPPTTRPTTVTTVPTTRPLRPTVPSIVPPSSTTSPSVPATTPTTSAAALPGAPPCDPNEPGANEPDVRPTNIFLGCATSADNLSNITWTSWTSTGATGSGTHAINNCQPDCAGGTFTNSPVTVQLSAPGSVNGLFVFTTISVTPTTSSGQPETDTVSSSSWGWVPNQ